MRIHMSFEPPLPPPPPNDDDDDDDSDDDDNYFYLGDAALYMQTTTFNTTGQKRWDAAVALKDFLCSKSEELFSSGTKKRVRVLELGSGNGWLAMTIVRKFCDSIDAFHATEMEAGGALDWLNLILDSNREKRKLSSKEREKIYATSLDWNEVILSDKEEEEVKDDYDAQMIDVDFLLGSDLVYDESGVKILPRVIAKLLRSRCRKTKSGFMLYAHTKHRYDGMDVDFFENLEKEGLVCEEVRKSGTKTPPPSPPPFESLFPDQRIAVFRISPSEE
ncbi:predicted protein [Bathycoccus prasinos]|uniref:Uncharacterized protein n=1 Tax=Bathycoccus prasinos TaxID=41875 RepID=K8ELE3_9CHLO|nr:predicted protein [Bathycoccus prasinos]CCO19047.1 predicted protein [Bathycoccus prasinos]|eukprot:XP_007509932.1 predicted protein [Bathycoccus prasinos]